MPDKTIYFLNAVMEAISKGEDLVYLKKKFILEYVDFINGTNITFPDLKIEGD